MEKFNPNHSLDVGAVVADVDMTITKDGQSPVTGINLTALVEVLLRKIPLLLISGSPYDSVYFGVATKGSLQQRIVQPLQAALREKSATPNLANLQIFYASGRGTVTFDPAGNEVRRPDRTDKDIDVKLRSMIFRSFLCGFYSNFRAIAQDQMSNDLIARLFNGDSTDEQVSELTRDLLKKETGVDVGALEKWGFGSELALVFHGIESSGPSIAERAQAVMRERKIPLTPDFFWAGGTDYAKASRIRKRDVIFDTLAKLRQAGSLAPNKSVLCFGDSAVDDFLTITEAPHLSVFLGAKSDAKNFPDAWLVVDEQGRDRQEANAFGVLLSRFVNNKSATSNFTLVRASQT